MRAICGIYKITNKINGKSYIGQSVNIKNRWYVHKATKDDYPIHRAIQKYGKNNFSWEVLEECSEQQLSEREIYYISKYNTFMYAENSNGYNLTPGGEQGNVKPVNQYSKDGKFIRRYNSIAEASAEVGKMVAQISSCCYKRCLSCGGYLWAFDNEAPMNYYEEMGKLGTTVDQYDLDGNFIRSFDTVPMACEFVNEFSKKKISKGQIVQCCKNDKYSAAGFLWRYHNDEPPRPYRDRYYCPILQLTKEGQVVNQFDSLYEASKKTGVQRSNIGHCLNGKRNFAGGYKWQRVNEIK